MQLMALDIGGANLKICWLNYEAGKVVHSRGRSIYLEMWKDPEALLPYLRELSKEEVCQAVAVTMTAELCDAFATPEEGVQRILSMVRQAFAELPVYVWHNGGGFYTLAEACTQERKVAAANWLASAEYLAKLSFLQERPALLVDMGSTTTDLLPLDGGRVQVKGRTDLERLMNGELIYAGVLRTFVPAIAGQVYVKGRSCPVSSEYFAIMADVYRVLGDIVEEDYSVATPDGKDRSRLSCLRRLTRVVDSDVETLGEKGILMLARYLKERQLQQVMQGIWQIYSRQDLAYPTCLIAAGQGRFLISEIAGRLGLSVLPWWEVAGQGDPDKPDVALTVYALAWLLAVKGEKNESSAF